MSKNRSCLSFKLWTRYGNKENNCAINYCLEKYSDFCYSKSKLQTYTTSAINPFEYE